jgi:hypothetical protein
MFQYAAGQSLALKNNTPLKFEVSSCWVNPLGDYSLSLETFNIDIRNNLITEKEHEHYRKYASRNGRLGLIYNALFANSKKYFKEKGFDFQPEFLDLDDGVFLHGWWQNERYFSEVRDTLLKDFSLKSPLSQSSAKIAEKMRDANSVSIHIRRLDYVSNPRTQRNHGTMEKDYYDKGLSIISARFKNPVIFIFSDDIPWVKENMTFPFETHYVEGNMAKPHEDIHLMSQCRHNIVANSSFSWWGAWLGTHPDQIVIAPVKWTNYHGDHNDRVPKSWIKI